MEPCDSDEGLSDLFSEVNVKSGAEMQAERDALAANGNSDSQNSPLGVVQGPANAPTRIDTREPGRFVGIENQGATCYLNSLIQTLFLTPEFRNRLFSIPRSHLLSFPVPRKIPAQLQELFARLLLGKRANVSTQSLTDTFGWTDTDNSVQQDVQELNRILFNALEKSLKGTQGSTLIDDLYKGTVTTQVTCDKCGAVSARDEEFLDLTMTVTNCDSLLDSFDANYNRPEIFDGDNQYHCGRCAASVDARKTCRLRRLPPVLTVSLLKFNFDSGNSRRFKTMRSFAYPERLVLGPYCDNDQLNEEETVYDLFSVIVHSGNTYSGHYHAFIRDIDELGDWDESCAAGESVITKPAANGTAGEVHFTAEDMGRNARKCIRQFVAQFEPPVAMDHIVKKLGPMFPKKQHRSMTIAKFIQSESSVFEVITEGDAKFVWLRNQPEASSLNGQGDAPSPLVNGNHVANGHHPPSTRWFDFNDSAVKSVSSEKLKALYGGRESAYMLFYRQAKLKTVDEARGNWRYGVPADLSDEVEADNRDVDSNNEAASVFAAMQANGDEPAANGCDTNGHAEAELPDCVDESLQANTRKTSVTYITPCQAFTFCGLTDGSHEDLGSVVLELGPDATLNTIHGAIARHDGTTEKLTAHLLTFADQLRKDLGRYVATEQPATDNAEPMETEAGGDVKPAASKDVDVFREYDDMFRRLHGASEADRLTMVRALAVSSPRVWLVDSQCRLVRAIDACGYRPAEPLATLADIYGECSRESLWIALETVPDSLRDKFFVRVISLTQSDELSPAASCDTELYPLYLDVSPSYSLRDLCRHVAVKIFNLGLMQNESLNRFRVHKYNFTTDEWEFLGPTVRRNKRRGSTRLMTDLLSKVGYGDLIAVKDSGPPAAVSSEAQQLSSARAPLERRGQNQSSIGKQGAETAAAGKSSPAGASSEQTTKKTKYMPEQGVKIVLPEFDLMDSRDGGT